MNHNMWTIYIFNSNIYIYIYIYFLQSNWYWDVLDELYYLLLSTCLWLLLHTLDELDMKLKDKRFSTVVGALRLLSVFATILWLCMVCFRKSFTRLCFLWLGMTNSCNWIQVEIEYILNYTLVGLLHHIIFMLNIHLSLFIFIPLF
jgi:hypothetical protein